MLTPDPAVIVVEDPGLLATVQDLGRHGFAHLGVPHAGAADPLSLRLANRLVGNADGDAGVETTLRGPRLRFTSDAVIAVAGAPAPVRLDRSPLEHQRAHPVRAGQTLTIGTTRTGVRTYLAVAGGVAVPAVLGSRSTDTLAGLGPPALRAGDRLPVGPGDRLPGGGVGRPHPGTFAPVDRTRADGPYPLRITLGPREAFFTAQALRGFLSGTYTVTPTSDRVGIRLSGPTLARSRPGAELPAEGLVTGAIQVPPDGQPILLLTNHSTTGGYPVVAVLALADLPVAAQLRPGARVRFHAVDYAEARRALLDQERLLDSRSRAHPAARAGR